MVYTKQTWVNSGASGGLGATSEVNAERLGYIETGIETISTDLDQLDATDIPSSGPSTVQDDLTNLATDKADATHTHTTVLTLTRMAPGTPFFVIWDGTDWRYGGAIVTARPSARTDLIMMAMGNTAGNGPSFALTDDVHLAEASA